MSEPEANVQTVLVVDDEVSICDIVGAYLRREGYEVFQAGSGEEAMEIVEQKDIDLVLSDIKMPGMSGVDLLKWIRQRENVLPVLITTGYPTLDTAIEALKLGAFDYLTKPFHLEEIGEKVSRALRNRRLEEENILFSKLVSLHEVTKVLSSTRSIVDLNRRFIDYCVKISRSSGGSLMFSVTASRLQIDQNSLIAFDEDFWRQPAFEGAAAWAVANGEPLLVSAGSGELPEGVPRLPEGVEAYIGFPLRTPQQTLGVLNLVRLRGAEAYSNVDLEIVNVLASQASISIENARLYQNIRDNYLKTIRGFALTVEAKDQYTHGHSENVMKYTMLLSERLGLTSTETEQIEYAALLHDIGKIGISDAILKKPGKLTVEEFEEIKKHPGLGARIISGVPFLKSLVPTVRHHHEWFVGGGYPDGIAGEEIPLGARILTVADVFEAVTSTRPYRKAMSFQEVFSLLEKEKGHQFDSGLVDAFTAVMREKTAE